MSLIRPLAIGSLATASILALAGCATPAEAETAPAQTQAPTSVQIEDNTGVHTIDLPPTSVVALDNRTFQTLADWGVALSAAAVSLMPDTISYTEDDSLTDVGNHREPNLEVIVAANPDLVINGQRFTQFQDDITALVPDAAVIDLDPREGEDFGSELKRQVEVLGEIFGKQAEAEALADEFDTAVDRVVAAYDGEQTVMGVITSGGEIGYVAPGIGRTLGPIFELAGLSPALEMPEGSEDHQGDDISVEAIAQSNPDWILVMDRDAAVAADDPAYVPGAEVIESSEALSAVTAVQEDQIVYMPVDTYTNEGIQTYTEFLNDLADAMESAR